MNVRRALASLALAGLAAAPAAWAAEFPPRRLVLRVAYTAPASSATHAGAVYFKDAFEQAAGGRVEVQLVPGAAHGDEATLVTELRQGAAQVAILESRAPLAPALQFVGLPFLFRDAAHRLQVAEGPGGRLLAQRLAEQSSLAVLAMFAGPVSVLATTTGPMTQPANLAGLKLRVGENPLALQGVQALGAFPFPLPLPWMMSAVYQGTVSGGLLDLQTALDLQAYGALRYMSHPATPFAADLSPVLADRRTLGALPRDLQQALVGTLRDAARREFELAEEATARALRDLQGRGVIFTPVDQAAFRAAMRPFQERAARLMRAQDLLAEIERAR